MSNEINKQLVKCPFCGGEVKLHISELDAFRNLCFFLCNDCDMEITYPYSNEEEAIKAFNTRKPIDRIVERLEKYRDDFMNDIYEELREDADNYRANRIINRFDEAIEIVKEEGGINEIN